MRNLKKNIFFKEQIPTLLIQLYSQPILCPFRSYHPKVKSINFSQVPQLWPWKEVKIIDGHKESNSWSSNQKSVTKYRPPLWTQLKFLVFILISFCFFSYAKQLVKDFNWHFQEQVIESHLKSLNWTDMLKINPVAIREAVLHVTWRQDTLALLGLRWGEGEFLS